MDMDMNMDNDIDNVENIDSVNDMDNKKDNINNSKYDSINNNSNDNDNNDERVSRAKRELEEMSITSPYKDDSNVITNINMNMNDDTEVHLSKYIKTIGSDTIKNINFNSFHQLRNKIKFNIGQFHKNNLVYLKYKNTKVTNVIETFIINSITNNVKLSVKNIRINVFNKFNVKLSKGSIYIIYVKNYKKLNKHDFF